MSLENSKKVEIKDNLKKKNLEIEGRTKKALEKFINSKGEYSNVAIIGDFGVGKSSIIYSYLENNEDIQPVYLNIPKFEHEKQEKTKVEEAKEIRKIITYLLLEQSKKDSSKVKCIFRRWCYKTRLEQIEAKINDSYALVQKKTYIQIFSFTLTIFIFFTINSFFDFTIYFDSFLYRLILIILSSIIIYNIINFFLNLEIKNLSVGKLKVEQNEQNTFLDEDTNLILNLLYLYSTMTKQKIVLIIEDLDRYENKIIFEELYQISNIKKDMPFVYLIQNKQFTNEKILKFFDAIVDLQSTKDILYLEDLVLKELEGEVSSNLIVTIVPYIEGIRQYNRIFNRYYLMKENYEKVNEINVIICDEIFCLAFLKELYYEDIQNESIKESKFKKILNIIFDERIQTKSYYESIKEEIEIIEKKIEDCKNKINEYKEQYLTVQNFEREALEKILKGYLYEKTNQTIQIGNRFYKGQNFLNNNALFKSNFEELQKYFEIENFSKEKDIIKKKEYEKTKINKLKKELEYNKKEKFNELSFENKIEIVAELKEIKKEKFEGTKLVIELVKKGYLQKHWDIYLTPNKVENEIEKNRRKIRYNFRQQNYLIESGNIIGNDILNNKSFIDLFHYNDFKNRIELINESLILFLWENNDNFDYILKHININIRKYVNDDQDSQTKEIMMSVLRKLFDSIKGQKFENSFIEKYDFIEYLERDFVETLISISEIEGNEDIKRKVINILFYCRLQWIQDNFTIKYVVDNIELINASIDDVSQFIEKIIVEQYNVIEYIIKFTNGLKNYFNIELLKQHRDKMLNTDFYVENLENVLFLIKNDIISKNIIKYLKQNAIPIEVRKEVSRYLDNNYNEIHEKNIYDLKAFRCLDKVPNLLQYQNEQVLLKILIERKSFKINVTNINFLQESGYYNVLYELFVERKEDISLIYIKSKEFTDLFYNIYINVDTKKQEEMLDEWILLDKLILKEDIIEKLYDKKLDLFNTYVKFNEIKLEEFFENYENEENKEGMIEEILVENKLEISILEKMIDIGPKLFSDKYDENINKYILQNTECSYDEIQDYIKLKGIKDKDYYLNLLKLDIEQFFEDYNLDREFMFSESGKGKNIKFIEKESLIINNINIIEDILRQAQEGNLISWYEIKNKIKVKR